MFTLDDELGVEDRHPAIELESEDLDSVWLGPRDLEAVSYHVLGCYFFNGRFAILERTGWRQLLLPDFVERDPGVLDIR
jgi:hypothetical protein